MPIESYAFGRMVVNGREYRRDLTIDPDGRVNDSWWRQSGHQLVLEDLADLIATRPSILVAGTGAAGLMRPKPGVEQALAARGIEFHALPTGQAVALYHQCCRQGARVAACFHLTC